MNAPPILVWFRQDLRLRDQPALHAACREERPVIPVYIWCDDEEQPWALGGASRWWLWKSLASLQADLKSIGSDMLIRHGEALVVLQELIHETNADTVYWNRRYEPHIVKRDTQIKSALSKQGVTAKSFQGSLLVEPHALLNASGAPYQVFTPFYRTFCAQVEPAMPLPKPRSVMAPNNWPVGNPIGDLPLQPQPDWAAGLRATFHPGESTAQERLRAFLDEAVNGYLTRRDIPAEAGTSTLSPHLHFGELSPREVWNAIQDHVAEHPTVGEGADGFARQLVWREFAHHILFHFPHTPKQPLREAYANFPWRHNAIWLRAWQQGQTGYPMVDAGMREMWTTGWMHNRVRMLAASFLVKHLLQPWQEGARWFWDTLVDADLANNTMGWQWAAGCGADAAPYFRIFNPMTQGRKFDASGAYVRRWIPELAGLSNKTVHAPWEASASELSDAGIKLGENYPFPMVDHKEARESALQALADMKDK